MASPGNGLVTRRSPFFRGPLASHVLIAPSPPELITARDSRATVPRGTPNVMEPSRNVLRPSRSGGSYPDTTPNTRGSHAVRLTWTIGMDSSTDGFDESSNPQNSPVATTTVPGAAPRVSMTHRCCAVKLSSPGWKSSSHVTDVPWEEMSVRSAHASPFGGSSLGVDMAILQLGGETLYAYEGGGVMTRDGVDSESYVAPPTNAVPSDVVTFNVEPASRMSYGPVPPDERDTPVRTFWMLIDPGTTLLTAALFPPPATRIRLSLPVG